MRTQSQPGMGRMAALLAVTMIAAMVAIGFRVQTASATGCTFRLAASGVNGADYTATEGEGIGGGFKIVVEKLTNGCTGGVNLTLTSGTATSPGDYADFGTLGVLFTTPSGTTQTVVLFPEDDATVAEGSEQFTVSLTAHAGDFVTAPTSQVLTILDNDGPPVFSFSAANYPVIEGAGTVLVTVNRSGATGAPVSVKYATSNGSATAPGDYTAIAATTLNFSDVQTSRTFTVSITDDSTQESTQSFNLILSLPSDGGTVGSDSTVTIADDDGTGTVQFEFATYTANESGGTASFTVTRTGGDNGPITALCSTTDTGGATALDYTAIANQSLTWNDGDASSETCDVAILPDLLVEGPQTFGLIITSSDIGIQDTAIVTINDDDGGGSLQFTSASYSGTENGGVITVTVTRTGSSVGEVSVDIQTTISGSTATVASDYDANSTTLTWSAGSSVSKTFTVNPVDDGVVEGSEFVNVTLTNPIGGASLGTPSTTQVFILDNESPLPVISLLSPAAGTISGGTLVTLTGNNFTGATSVTFGGFACASFTVVSAVTITCVTPAQLGGTVEVVVNTPSGSNTTVGTNNDYTYTGGPTITSLDPATGLASGSTIVTITGTNFTASGMTVKVDGALVTFTYIDTTTIVAVAPPHSAGTVDVRVTTPGGTSPNTVADDFTYTGASTPAVTLLSPASGVVGTTVIITGSGLSGATLVTFGGIAATYTVNNDGQITASVPAGTPAGVVDVRVTTPSGTSTNTSADNFNNTSASPTISYTLFFRFTLIVWTGPNGISALAALRGQETPDNPATNNVQALVGAIWRFDASSQTFKGYFPGSDGIPGANDFTTLSTGVGYFVALLNPGTVTWTTLGAN